MAADAAGHRSEAMRSLAEARSFIDDEELRRLITDLKKLSRGGGMAENEYFYWMKYVRDHAPQRLLVWGLGYDSALIDRLNAGGLTAFLEPDVSWVAKSSNSHLTYKGYDEAAFGTTVASWRSFVREPHATARDCR
eukprot:TRINITY_DN19796_c0_g1_i2.p2 TRINITY_DN19796_c0_g1~~TRINITY_DN19796_c0_g1_i2.p2  ORF type:complete len:136 (-),score=15.75 TRINITY_DN19796_c0_g1_i2:355-762(-)